MTDTIRHPVAVEHRGGHRLWIRFDDGVEGERDFWRFLFYCGPIGRLLRDFEFFAKVFIHPESATLTWPNGYDYCPILLYAHVMGRSFESLLFPEHDADRRD